MADFDIFNPTVTQVVKGVEGKLILIHSDSVKSGKTSVGSDMPKPYYLRFEQGANAINGLPYAALTSWSDFKKVNKMLTNPKTIDQARELYTTIIVDTLDVAIGWCNQYICASQGVTRLNDGNGGYGLWQEYKNEWSGEFSKLINAGYTVYFIAHSEEKEIVDGITGETYNKLVPKGDKRTIDYIVEAVDFIGYVKANGVDEEGNVVKSSCYFAETKEYKAGSRFDYMPRYIKEFSAENLQKAIKYAIERKEQEDGVKSVTLEEMKSKEVKKLTYEELLDKIKPIMTSLWTTKQRETTDIVENYLGVGKKVSETTKSQVLQLEMILSDLEDLND